MLAGLASADEAPPLAHAAAKATGLPLGRAALVTRAAHEALATVRGTTLGAEDAPLLVALAAHESHFRAEVESCDVVGDGGVAVGLWQEHARGKRRERLCGGGAAEQAREAVRHLSRCPGTWTERVACYAGRRPEHPIVRVRVELAERLARETAR